MNRILVSFLLALACLANGARADEPPAPCENAALWYWRCFNELGLDKTKVDRYIELLEIETPSDEQKAEIASLQQNFEQAMDTAQRAATKPHCCFGIDREEGMNALLPHLAHMRDLCKMARGEANNALRNGDRATAMQRFSLICSMPNALAADRTMIRPLVATACTVVAINLADQWLNANLLSNKDREFVATQLQNTAYISPDLLPQIIRDERDLFVNWISDLWKKQESFDEIVEVFKGMGVDTIQMIDPADFEKQLDQYRRIMTLMADAAEANKLEVLDQQEKDIARLRHGPLAAILVPPMKKCREELASVASTREAVFERLNSPQPKP